VKGEQADLLDPSDSIENELLSCQGSGLVKAADVNLASKGDPERLRAENGYRVKKKGRQNTLGSRHQENRAGASTPYLNRAISDWFTASDNSIGSSGGMTEVMIRMQSKSSWYLERPFLMPSVHT